MKSEIDAFFLNDVSTFTQRLADLDRRLGPSAEPHEDKYLEELTAALHESIAACRRLEISIGPETQWLQESQKRVQKEISPWFDRSWFMHRARLKPRGYPGDYQLLAAIYDGTPKSRGLGGYLDLYFLNTTLGWAVKTRLQAVRRFLIEEVSHRRGNVSILNVACGPCREYREGLNAPEEGALHVTCLDSDQEALDYVRAHAAEMPGIHRLDCTCYNALRMSSSKANVAKFGRPDIIYSVGLCDYIPDKYLVAMLRGWRESLGEGGVVYVAFKDCRRYDKTEYQWMVDWFFLQRTEEECRGLFEQAGYDPGALEMARDESGVIMNFVSRSKADRLFRIDQSGAQRAEHSPSVAVPHLDKTSGSAAPKEAV